MCLLLFSYDPFGEYPLEILANRDEFFNRPTLSSGIQNKQGTHFIAGLDLIGGGTWMGFTDTGKFAAITNFRDPKKFQKDAPTRGSLVSDFLLENISAADYLARIKPIANQFNGFNLLVYDHKDGKKLLYFGSEEEVIRPVEPGVHGLSNALLDSAWPKVIKGKEAVKSYIENGRSKKLAFSILNDNKKAPLESLPSTGVSQEKELGLSPICIKMEGYGTRTSTLFTISKEHRYYWEERNLQKNTYQAYKGHLK